MPARAPQALALHAGAREAGEHALPNAFTFELGERREDVELELPGGGRADRADLWQRYIARGETEDERLERAFMLGMAAHWVLTHGGSR